MITIYKILGYFLYNITKGKERINSMKKLKFIFNNKSEEIIQDNNESKVNESAVNVKYINNMKSVENLKKLIGNTEIQNKRVNEQHDQLADLTKDVQLHMEEISNYTNETDKITEELSKESDKLLAITDESIKMSKDGKVAIEEIMRIVKVLEQEYSKNMDMINNLVNKFTDVKSVVGLINDIASQTNLLALNASIEAARAGEHGKGFSVVAEEVRKLSDQTKKRTIDITELIENIFIETTNVQSNSENSIEVIKSGVETTVEVVDKIESSLVSISRIDEEVKKVIEILNQQKQNISNMTNEIGNVDDILKITAKEITSHIEEASIVDNYLQSINETIKDLDSKFAIK